jgi:hypothetical protein
MSTSGCIGESSYPGGFHGSHFQSRPVDCGIMNWLVLLGIAVVIAAVV